MITKFAKEEVCDECESWTHFGHHKHCSKYKVKK